MQFVPTIIILALLTFFIVLATTLFLWYWRHHKAVVQKRQFRGDREESEFKPPQILTLRDGKAIPKEIAIETISDKERYSLDLQSPGLEKDFEFDVEKGFTKTVPSRSSKRASRQSLKSILADRGQTWAPGKPPWLNIPPEQLLCGTDAGKKIKQPSRTKQRDRSRSIPRPALINIERRGSGQTQRSSDTPSQKQTRKSVGRRTSSQVHITPEMQEKRRGMDITESLFNAYKGKTPWTEEVLEMPPSSAVMPGPARTVASSTRSSSNRWSIPASASVHSSTVPTTMSLVEGSRVASALDPIKPPAPLFSSVSYQEAIPPFTSSQEPDRKSFLTITDSAKSSTSSEHAVLGYEEPVPTMAEVPHSAPMIPTTSSTILPYNEQSRPIKAMSTPAPNPPQVLERVRAFGRRHQERPTSNALRLPGVLDSTTHPGKPLNLAQRRQISSELLRHIDRPRSTAKRDNGTSELVQQLEQSASIVQQQSRASNLKATAQAPTSAPRQLDPVAGPGQLHKVPSGSLQQRRKPKKSPQRSPSIEIKIPPGNLSFFDSSTPTPPRSGNDLGRGPSVLSNRSGFTIASSDVSSNWDIGKAELVNIYPSVGDEETAPESHQAGATDAPPINRNSGRTPPYAKMLRSKYGQYPRGMRDKALPRLPMSPLRQSINGD